MHFLAEMTGVDVGWRAGQHHAVGDAQHCFQVHRLGDSRQHQRHARGAEGDCIDIFHLSDEIGMKADIFNARWDDYDRSLHDFIHVCFLSTRKIRAGLFGRDSDLLT